MNNTSNDRKTHPLNFSKIKSGDILAIVQYVKVKEVIPKHFAFLGESRDMDFGKPIQYSGKDMIEAGYSSDQYEEEVKIGKIAAAEILVSSYNRPFTVCYEKADGTPRTLRGRLVKPEPVMGRSMVEDLDLEITEKNRLRQVDHRTISFLIVDGVKYTVK